VSTAVGAAAAKPRKKRKTIFILSENEEDVERIIEIFMFELASLDAILEHGYQSGAWLCD
jgi:hypothetical protein